MIVSSESLDEKFNDLEVILGRLNENKMIISNWESQGEILYEFIQIRKEYNKYKNEYIDEYGSFRKSTLNRRVKSADGLDRLIRRLKTLIHSFKKFRVEDLSETAKAVKTEIKRILLNWDTDLNTIQSIINKDVNDPSIPNQYLLDSEDLNLNDKNNALKKYVAQTLPHFIRDF